jgi:integrase
MAALNKLTDTKIKNAPTGKHSDGGGLILRVTASKQWLFRFTMHKKRSDMGLGSYPSISLKQARELATTYRKMVAEGINPIAQRDKATLEASQAKPRLKAITAEAFEAHKRTLVGDGKAGKWLSPLRLHILPALGAIPVEDINQRDIQRALKPIWLKIPETARKALARLNIVMRYAAASGLDVDMQATMKAKALLGAKGDVQKHIASVPWQELPTFYKSLGATMTELALKLTILTALRSGAIRHLRYEYIENDILTVPAELMKGNRGKKTEFRVPLSKEVIEVIDQLKPFERDGDGYLFPSVRKGVMSDATMARHMERKGMSQRPHGFRSSFRMWCAEATDTPREIAETALSHVTGSKVERAYNRSDYLERRKVLMQRWADYCSNTASKVIPLHDAR